MRPHNHLVAPSLLSADFAYLRRDIDMINQSEADWFHVDVMDGRFVPNITFGMMIVEAIKRYAQKPLDVHLMIVEPEKYIEAFRDAGADHITVHLEATPHVHRAVQMIKACGAKAGVAINPHTPVQSLEHVLEMLDLVIVMSVNPGFGAQKFIYQSLEKIRTLKEMIVTRNCPTLIEIDGGVGLQNAEAILNAGTDVLVSGNFIFKAADPLHTIHQLKHLGHDAVLV